MIRTVFFIVFFIINNIAYAVFQSEKISTNNTQFLSLTKLVAPIKINSKKIIEIDNTTVNNKKSTKIDNIARLAIKYKNINDNPYYKKRFFNNYNTKIKHLNNNSLQRIRALKISNYYNNYKYQASKSSSYLNIAMLALLSGNNIQKQYIAVPIPIYIPIMVHQ